jgi:hypothetical protein
MTSQQDDQRDDVHVVRVGNAQGPVASGVLIAPDLVLTSLHAINRDAVEVLFDKEQPWTGADVVWESEELDVALLRTLGKYDAPRPVWAIAERGVEVTAFGYSDREPSDPLWLLFKVRAVVVQETAHLYCELVSLGLAAGMSGGPVVGPDGELVGVVSRHADDHLVATSVRALFAIDEFRTVADLVDERPVHLAEMARRAARALLSPTPANHPLRGSFPGFHGSEVPFVGRKREISLLVSWCESRASDSVAVIQGASGTGKTRLAIELCQLMESRGWLAGFVGQGQLGWGEEVVADGPTLLVVEGDDYRSPAELQQVLDLKPAEGGALRTLLIGVQGPPVYRTDLQVSLDEPISDEDKIRLGEATAYTALIDWMAPEVIAGSVGSARTPLDVIRAIGRFTNRPAPPSEPQSTAAPGWEGGWVESLVRQGVSRQEATDVVALVMLVRPMAADLQSFVDGHLTTGSARAAATFGPYLPDLSDTEFAQLLDSSDSPEKVFRDAIDWCVDKPADAARVLSALTRSGLGDVERRRHMAEIMSERIEPLAEAALAAQVDGFQPALIALIDKVRPDTDAKVVQEWAAALRRARGVGRLNFGGLADRRATRDHLDRGALIRALAEMVRSPLEKNRHDDATGPSVIAVDGPWGAGKTSVMGLVQDQLDSEEPVDRPGWWRRRWRGRRLTVAEALWVLWRWRKEPEPVAKPKPGPEPEPASELEPESGQGGRRELVTVWFNPWAHQSSEQVWAGLARAILKAVTGRLHAREPEQARYWLRRNAGRLDRGQLRRHLFHAVRSPMLKVAFFALLVPIAAALLRYEASFPFFGFDVPATRAAAWLVGGMVVLSLAHTLLRLLFGRAAAYCPPGVLDGPVLSGVLAQPGSDQAVRDPLYHARSGYLYLLQHDIQKLLLDAEKQGLEVVVFIDDLDRCTSKTTAEVLEAVNLFLSEQFPATRFVIGLDMGVVADQIDSALGANSVRRYFDDPSAGWTFLRKLIQLPVVLPRIPAATLDRLVGEFLGAVEQDDEFEDNRPARQPNPLPPTAAPAQPRPPATESRPPATAPPARRSADTAPTVPASRAEDTNRRVSRMEANLEVRQRIRERLHALPVPSARETKRLLTIWQFYVRVLAYHDEIHKRTVSAAAEIRRARATVLVAEIVARWPAQLPQLLGTEDGTRGLRRLLDAAPKDDVTWIQTANRIGLNHTKEKSTCTALRDILRSDDGPQAVALVEHLF